MKGQRIDEPDVYGCTPLHYAAFRGATVSCLLLLQVGSSISLLGHFCGYLSQQRYCFRVLGIVQDLWVFLFKTVVTLHIMPQVMVILLTPVSSILVIFGQLVGGFRASFPIPIANP